MLRDCACLKRVRKWDVQFKMNKDIKIKPSSIIDIITALLNAFAKTGHAHPEDVQQALWFEVGQHIASSVRECFICSWNSKNSDGARFGEYGGWGPAQCFPLQELLEDTRLLTRALSSRRSDWQGLVSAFAVESISKTRKNFYIRRAIHGHPQKETMYFYRMHSPSREVASNILPVLLCILWLTGVGSAADFHRWLFIREGIIVI